VIHPRHDRARNQANDETDKYHPYQVQHTRLRVLVWSAQPNASSLAKFPATILWAESRNNAAAQQGLC